MRNYLILFAVALAAAPLAAQNHTVEIFNYMGGSAPGSPPWGIYRNADLDGDGVYLTTSPSETFDFAMDGSVLINHVNGMNFQMEGGAPVLYAVTNGTGGDMVLRFLDLNNDGDCNDAGEQTVFADFQNLVGGNAGSAAMDIDPNTGEIWVTDDLYISSQGGSQASSGVHVLVDLNNDGDAMDAGEWTQVIDATGAGVSVLGDVGQQVSIDIGDFEAVMVDSNSVVIAFAQQDRMIYAMQDMNGDGDAQDPGEMWNFLNLVGDKAGLTVNADIVAGILPNPSCASTSGSGLYATLERMDIGHGDGPGGIDVYWIASSASSSSCNGAAGFVFQGMDLNGDGDLNDAGEVTAFHDSAQSALPTPPSGIFGMTAHDGGVSIWTDDNAKSVYYLWDANNDRKSGVGEYKTLAAFPINPYADGIVAVPVGAYPVPLPTPPYWLPFGQGGVGSNAQTPAIDHVGTPVNGASFDVTLTNALPNVPIQLLVGFSNTVWQRPGGPLGLPFDMGPVGAPGNTLYVALDFTFPMVSDALGKASFTVNVPLNPTLIGRQVYFQWGCADGINARGAVLSNAAQSVIE